MRTIFRLLQCLRRFSQRSRDVLAEVAGGPIDRES